MFHSQNDRIHVTSRRRLRAQDYSEPGYYFLTICIRDWSHRLGSVVNGEFQPTGAGEMVAKVWKQAPLRFPGAQLDVHCAMPNHFHRIVGIGTGHSDEPPFPTVIAIMDWFKSVTTVEYIRGVKQAGWPAFVKHLWLEGHYDRVMRNEEELLRVREYVVNNPITWQKDNFYLR